MVSFAFRNGIASNHLIGRRINDGENVLVLQVDVNLPHDGIVLRHSRFAVEVQRANDRFTTPRCMSSTFSEALLTIKLRMKISPNTVKVFLRLAMAKMGASSRFGILSKFIKPKP